jgi:hypothetical protein
MPQSDVTWRPDGLVAVAGECNTNRGRAFATTPAMIDMQGFDYLIIRVSELSLPTALKGKVWVKEGTDEDNGLGYMTDLGGTDFPFEFPKSDFVASVGKVLPAVRVAGPWAQLDFTTDQVDGAGEVTLQYLRRRSAAN